jgi:hypothetical protein
VEYFFFWVLEKNERKGKVGFFWKAYRNQIWVFILFRGV